MIDFDLIRKDNRFIKWGKYAPHELQYTKYAISKPHIITTGYKITDVYYAFVNARASFMFSDSKNFGDLSTDDPDIYLFTKIHLLLNAIMEYSTTIDLSFQVIMAYIQKTSFKSLTSQNSITEKDCDYKKVIAELKRIAGKHNYRSEQAKKLKNIVNSFYNNKDVIELRNINNRLKHRGAINIENFWPNDIELFEKLKLDIPVLKRPEYTKEKIEQILLSYHTEFTAYFDEIIKEIIPEDYLDKKMDLIEFNDSIRKMLDLTKQ